LENAKLNTTNRQEKSTMSINYVEEASFVEEEKEEQAAVSDLEKSNMGIENDSAADEENAVVGDVETAITDRDRKQIAPDEKAIVEEEIRPGESGRVKFQSSWWPATSDQEITFKPGEAVRVVASDNVTLIVEG
jgi:NfeD-like C-terminal, partner-binding